MTLNAVEIIYKKRDGHHLTKDEIHFFISEFHLGKIPDYQMSSLLMSIYFQGMNFEETSFLTSAMMEYSERWDFSSIQGPKVDKHSTGGVGDKISIPLAPLAATLGLKVPMMAGRGLGHTGGTVDKMESIPRFRTDLQGEQLHGALAKVGAFLIGQTKLIAPIDKKMYALRDVTGTVPSLPLITSSILSKKLVEGMDALLLDVKFGDGAFMKDIAEAKKLAEAMVKVAKQHGKKAVAYLTNMDTPLGYKIGNWPEIEESLEVLKGKGPSDVRELTLTFAAEMMILGGLEEDFQKAYKKAQAKLDSGEALHKFFEMVAFQGGDVEFLKDPSRWPKTKHNYEIKYQVKSNAYVAKIYCFNLGMLCTHLGAQRATKDDLIDLAAGLTLKKKVGDEVKEGDLLAILHTNKELSSKVLQRFNDCFHFSEKSESKNTYALIEEKVS